MPDIGKSLSHYRILDKIGRGGMGEVFLAQDTSLERKVAIKFLPEDMRDDPVARERFLREAKSAATLDHPHICVVHEAGEVEGSPFIVMEYVEGESLKERLARGPLPLEEALQAAAEIAEAMAEAHSRHIIHRDLKPANVMLTRAGHVKVMDFGLAKRLLSEEQATTEEETLTQMTRMGTVIGTLTYMSPEQLLGQPVDRRSDIFSFGTMLYEMLTGVHPFRKDAGMATAAAILSEDPPAALHTPGIPPQLSKLVSEMLAKTPARRFQSMRGIHEQLKQILLEVRQRPGETGVSSLMQLGRILRRSPAAGTRGDPGAGMSADRQRMIVKGSRVGAVLLAIFALLVVATPWGQRMLGLLRHGTGPVANKHIAVLPFYCVGEGEEKQAFCTGLVEILTSKLSQLEQFHGTLRVVPASEIRREKLSSVGEARRAFGINFGVTGSVQFMRDDVRLTVNLVDAATLRQLDSGILSYLPDRLAELQDTTVRSLLQMLAVELQPGSLTVLAAGGTQVPRCTPMSRAQPAAAGKDKKQRHDHAKARRTRRAQGSATDLPPPRSRSIRRPGPRPA